jgi:hypothetical protein
MELASMLAGEKFTDHPRSVSRSIAAFLRTYNDMIDDEHRQDLYEIASKCVGTAGSDSTEMFRASRLLAWGDEMRRRGFHWPVPRRLRRRARPELSTRPAEAGRYAANSIRNARMRFTPPYWCWWMSWWR